MNFKFVVICVVLTIGFAGIIFTQNAVGEKEFTSWEIDEMKNTAVLITMEEGTFMIELFPEDAPNTVNNFLKLVESGYYDGLVFHRIIPKFMIQTGDPTTKDPEVDRSLWGQGGPGYIIKEEFNTLQHDRGMVSMARQQHVDSAGSQFFIVHNDSNFLDGKYTVFGRLVPGTHSVKALDIVANIPTDDRDTPLDVSKATIINAKIIANFSTSEFAEPDRNVSLVKTQRIAGGSMDTYSNNLHKISFDLPYRWDVNDKGTADYLNLAIEPNSLEHNAQAQIDASGFIPQVLVRSEERNIDPTSKLFSIQGGETPKVSSHYVFENED